MLTIFVPGDPVSESLRAFKAALGRKLGAEITRFAQCTDPAFGYGPQCQAAVREVQTRAGLVADGIAGPLTQATLGLDTRWPILPKGLTPALVRGMFPNTRPSNIERHLPYVLAGLRAIGPGATGGALPVEIVLSALATIRAETEGFIPISEGPSRFNTNAGEPAFSHYVGMLGNRSLQDAQNFCGRGFVQLTGRDNFKRYGDQLGLDLLSRPELANKPEIAACLLAQFIAACAGPLLKALCKTPEPDFKAARRLVNGGSHGLDRYTDAYRRGWEALKPAGLTAVRRRRAKVPGERAAAPLRRRTDARADPLDLRDRAYQPRVSPLPAQYPPAEGLARHLGAYTHRAGLILDQGKEGSCTGFGLACVINFQRWRLAGYPARKFASVSPRMLYEMARRYDEYEGEAYDGSSCRGAIRGFHYNGVCSARDWPYDTEAREAPHPDWVDRARDCTLGVYYRIDAKVIADVQAAIVEAGAIYVSLRTHEGWHDVPSVRLSARSRTSRLPEIAWPQALDGGVHALALVGFDSSGFILQNSWGKDWGAGGFARLSYADWQANVLDAWVLALGVPGVLARAVALRLPPSKKHPAGLALGSGGGIDARRYIVEMGNDGRVDNYYGDDARQRRLDAQACGLPSRWFQDHAAQQPWRLAIYAHGGLTSFDDALRKTATMAPYFLGNGIYPVFLGWKTGGVETLKDVLEDGWSSLLRSSTARAGGAMLDRLRESRDEAIETLARGPMRALWNEMKENAQRAQRAGHGLDLLAMALRDLAALCPTQLQVHLVGHSAGSILLGHLLQRMQSLKAPQPASVHLYAPACTVEFSNANYGAYSDRLHLHVLSDRAEQDDRVTSLYGKSLLYLVANALEADKRTPLLGMARSFDAASNGKWSGLSDTLDALNRLQSSWDDAQVRERLYVYEGRITQRRAQDGRPALTEQASHGGFDNDVDALTRVLTDILGQAPGYPVMDLSRS